MGPAELGASRGFMSRQSRMTIAGHTNAAKRGLARSMPSEWATSLRTRARTGGRSRRFWLRLCRALRGRLFFRPDISTEPISACVPRVEFALRTKYKLDLVGSEHIFGGLQRRASSRTL